MTSSRTALIASSEPTRVQLARFPFFVKRVLDILVAGASLPLVLPVLGLTGILLRMDSPGPVLYRDRRIGLNGVVFDCFKFRTMNANGDRILEEYLNANPRVRGEWEQFRKLRGHDPRVTRIGAVLRRFSLDELPQVLNVLRGEMSLVGPRPYMLKERDLMGRYYDVITLVRPGITGLWQVSGRNEITFKERLVMESGYVHSWSLWTDIGLLLKTTGVLINRRGAY